MIPLLLLACAAHIDPAQIDSVLALTGDADAGNQVYKDNCADCHDDDGRGQKSAILPDLIPANTDDDIVENILAGPSIMPNFVNHLEDQQVADVFAYLRATFGEYDPSLAEE